jgi:hypothetical protein
MAAIREQGRQDGCDMIDAFVWRSDCNEWMKSSELKIILPPNHFAQISLSSLASWRLCAI